MTAQFARAPHQGRSATTAQSNPQAALLIDFDNVTMGIRSDLSKELKNLLGSDFIKGKVAVQRAYADWRRYPQYIVPLAESSVDLIFAPAYGSSKKNATDIRLAIDALELVFTRPEIGTYILLSGDSDFSSLVLKLKEYGKYVIGVGIRESASDLLVQNCDEYYSYSALTGLTRTTEDTPLTANDPWELVDMAVRQMADAGDVMRSDRLKQVILELDPGFDEKTLGYTKFNRFLQEAASRGLLALTKLENGQFEVALAGDGPPRPMTDREDRDDREGRRSRRRGGRGRRDVERRNGDGGAAEPAAAAQAVPVDATAPDEPAPGPEQPKTVGPAAPPPDLEAAYALLRRAVEQAARGGIARDSDVKRRLLEISPDWDEAKYGFSKFSRFLRQAHDAGIVSVTKLDNGVYEVALGEAVPATSAPPEPPAARGRSRADGAGRGARPATDVPSPSPAAASRRPDAGAEPTPPAKPGQPSGATVVVPTASAARSIGLRRGSRGRPLASEPPPLLEGQAVAASAPGPAPEPERAPTARVESPDHAARGAPAANPSTERRRGGRGAKAAKPAPEPGAAGPVARQARGGVRQKDAAPAAGASASAKRGRTPTPAELGLPTQPVAVVSYLATEYKGVGQKMAESLVEAFGANRVFDGLLNQPDRVKEILGDKRGEKLLDLWTDDWAARLALHRAHEQERQARTGATTEPAARRAGGSGATGGGARPRRGGRRGGPRRTAPKGG